MEKTEVFISSDAYLLSCPYISQQREQKEANRKGLLCFKGRLVYVDSLLDCLCLRAQNETGSMHSLTQLHPQQLFAHKLPPTYTHTQPYMKFEEWRRPFSQWLAFALPSTSRKKGGHSLWMQARMAWFVVPGRDVCVHSTLQAAVQTSTSFFQSIYPGCM